VGLLAAARGVELADVVAAILNFSPAATSAKRPALKLRTGRPPIWFWTSAMPMVPILA